MNEVRSSGNSTEIILADLSADDPGELVGVDGLDVVGVEPELELVAALRCHRRPVVLLLQGELQGKVLI